MKILEKIEDSRIYAILMICIYLSLAFVCYILYYCLTGEKIIFGGEYDENF